jgi:2-methylcitrate dehydratase PrpD
MIGQAPMVKGHRSLINAWGGNVNYTRVLSHFVVDCRFEDFTPDVIEVARKCVLDWIGVTVVAVGQPAVLLLKETVEDMGGRQQASILWGMEQGQRWRMRPW